jgi:hypothetical protein
MQELGFRIGLYQGRMKIIVAEKIEVAILFEEGRVEVLLKIEDGTFIRHSMGMCDGPFIAWFGDQYTTTVGIK